MRLERRWVASLAVCLVAALVGACGGSTAPAAPGAQSQAPKPSQGTTQSQGVTPVKFLFPWLPTAGFLPVFLAQSRGYYKAAGLDVSLTNGKGSVLAAQQVGNGQYDIGMADLTSMAIARGKGAPLKSFMVFYPKSPFGVFAAKSEGLSTWKDLYGKTVATSAGSPEQYLLPATFKKLGLDYSRVKIVNANPANKASDYMAGKTDAVGTDLAEYGPVVQPARASYALYFGDVLEVPYHGLFARDDYIQAHPQVIRAFTAATVKALQALESSPQVVREAVDYMIKINPGQNLTPQPFIDSWNLYAKFLTSPATKGHPTGWQSSQAWASTLQVLHDYAGLQGSTNPADYFTNEFLP